MTFRQVRWTGAGGQPPVAVAEAAATGIFDIVKRYPVDARTCDKLAANLHRCRIARFAFPSCGCYRPAAIRAFRGIGMMKIVAGNSNRPLAEAICSYLNMPIDQGRR